MRSVHAGLGKHSPTFFRLAIVKPKGDRATLQEVAQSVGARIPLLADDPDRLEAALLPGPAQASEKIVDNRIEPCDHRFAGLVEEVFDPSGPHRSSNNVECR